jgi:hypothetical protein
VTNNNGFWIGFISTSITITTNSNSSQSMTAEDSLQSFLECKCLLFHCDRLVSDLRMVTSTATALNDDCLTNESFFSARLLIWSIGNHGECPLSRKRVTEPLPINGLLRLFVAEGTCVWRVIG